jgi:regulator of protease activity HflC (stomatin/prohibitin superfamily)
MTPQTRNLVIVIVSFLMFLFVGYQPFKVWSAKLDGEAKFAEAEYSRRVAVLEAQAKLDSASRLADAEVARAKGVAQANKIIGDSLHGNEDYLKYLWINQLENNKNSVIYVPTETNLPILEAQRLSHLPGEPPVKPEEQAHPVAH